MDNAFPADHDGFAARDRERLPLQPDQVPGFLYQTERSRELGDFGVVSHNVHVVSGRLADVLRRFDLGAPPELGPGHRRVELYPMELRAADKTTHIDDYIMLYVATEKDSFVRELSAGFLKQSNTPAVLTSAHDPELALTSAALDGPDLWREPGVANGYFFSDRLVTAIRETGIKDIGFTPCLITE